MKLPRFNLRELFLLVVIAAMGCGWWVDRRQIAILQLKLATWRQNALGLQWFAEREGWDVEWQSDPIAPKLILVDGDAVRYHIEHDAATDYASDLSHKPPD